MRLSNSTLQIIIIALFSIICAAGILKSMHQVLKYKQPPGDDLDEHDFINQENPFYYE